MPNLDSLQLGPEMSSGVSELFGQLLAEFKALETTTDTEAVEKVQAQEPLPDTAKMFASLMTKGIPLNDVIRDATTLKVEAKSTGDVAVATVETDLAEKPDLTNLLTPEKFVQVVAGAENDKNVPAQGKIPEASVESESQSLTRPESVKNVSVEMLLTKKEPAPLEVSPLNKGTPPSDGKVSIRETVSPPLEVSVQTESKLTPGPILSNDTVKGVRSISSTPVAVKIAQTDQPLNPVKVSATPAMETSIVPTVRPVETVGSESPIVKPGAPVPIAQVEVEVTGKPGNPRGEPATLPGAQVVTETSKEAAQRPFSQVFRPQLTPIQESIDQSNEFVETKIKVDTKPTTQLALSKPTSGEEVAKVAQLMPQGLVQADEKKNTKAVVSTKVETDTSEKPIKLSMVSKSIDVKPVLNPKNLLSDSPSSSIPPTTQSNGTAEPTGIQTHFSLIPGEIEPGTTTKQEVQFDGRTIKVIESKVDEFGDVAVKHIRYVKDGGEQSIRIRLMPRSLGSIEIHVKAHMNSVEVMLTPSQAGAREAIEMQLTGLREKLSSEGVEVSQITVQSDAASTHQRENSFSRHGDLGKHSQDGSKREHSQERESNRSKAFSHSNENWVSHDGRLNLVV